MFPTRCKYCGKPISMQLLPGENWKAVEVRDGVVVDHKPACLEALRKREADARRDQWIKGHPEVAEKARRRHRLETELSEMDRAVRDLFKGGEE